MQFIVGLALLIAPVIALAWPPDTTKEELALLPPWCAFTQSSWGSLAQPERYSEYMQRYGNGWTHMHHYCYGLVSVNRLRRLATPRASQAAVIKTAKGEINYVLGRTEKNFPFRPEMIINLARLQIREGNFADAEGTARALIADWPAFADGHALLAEILIRTGRKDAAQAVLDKGDELVSDKERFARLKSILPGR